MIMTGLMTDHNKDDVDWCDVHFPSSVSVWLIDVLIYCFIVYLVHYKVLTSFKHCYHQWPTVVTPFYLSPTLSAE